MLIVSLIFYQKLRKDMEAIGFIVNFYDPYVANNMVHYKQMTITWHVYDLKLYHSDKGIFYAFIQCNKGTY